MLTFLRFFVVSFFVEQDLSLVVKGSTGKRNSKDVPFTQFFVTAVTDEAGMALYSFVSLQPVAGLEAEPSQTMVGDISEALLAAPVVPKHISGHSSIRIF